MSYIDSSLVNLLTVLELRQIIKEVISTPVPNPAPDKIVGIASDAIRGGYRYENLQTCNVPWCLGCMGDSIKDSLKSVRVKFKIRSTIEGLPAWGKVYRLKKENITNNLIDTAKAVPIGKEHQNPSIKYKEFIEEFQDINIGDYLILFCYATGRASMYIKDFVFCYDLVVQ